MAAGSAQVALMDRSSMGLPGGAGWILLRRDDVLEIDVRLTLETDDKQQIYMIWKALRHGPKEVIERGRPPID